MCLHSGGWALWFELTKPYTLGCAHLALHSLCLKLLLFGPLLAVGYVMLALLAVSDGSLLQILQLVLEDTQGHLISIQAVVEQRTPGYTTARQLPGEA